MATSSNVCEICKSSGGRYTCPRCNAPYCSTACYQSEGHSECSENFFKDCVDEMLHSTQPDQQKKRNVEELLGRVNELDERLLDSDDDDDVVSLEERMKDVDLDNSESVWSRLTDEEKREYFEFLRSGDLTAVVWEPFWTKEFRGKIVDLHDLDQAVRKCPPIVKIKDFKSISTKQPAPCVRHNLTNVLAAYAFTTRYFNGDHHKEPAEATSCIFNVSLALKSNRNFQSFDEAVKSVVDEYKNMSGIETSEGNERLLMADTEDILKGPHVSDGKLYVLSSLSDLSTLLKSALRKNAGELEKLVQSTETVKMNVKKLGYYLSYVKDVLSDETQTK